MSSLRSGSEFVRPFPSANDFAAAKRFYDAPGFEKLRAVAVRFGWVVLCASAFVACGRPSLPPEPPGVHGDARNPSGIRRIDIEHLGCPMGQCAVYRVSISEDCRFEYEGRKFVRQVGLQTGNADDIDVFELFRWLGERPELFTASGRLREHGADLERLSFRFVPRQGEAIVVQTDTDFGDLWRLSALVDGIVLRGVTVRGTAGP